MTLHDEEKDMVVHYRIERSYQALQEAKDNCQLKHWNLTSNRLYYAVFYMVLALILKDGVSAKSHNGVYTCFNLRYIKTGRLTKEEGALYRKLFSMRHTGDYDDCFDWEEADVLPLINPVEQLIDKIRTLI